MLFILMVVVAPASAASYFVTQSGAGSQNGLTLANAWSVANYNSSAAPTGGDTVFFSGTITSTIVVATNGTGNSAGRLTLNFSGSCSGCTVATLSTANPRISLSNRSFITLFGGPYNAGATFAAGTGTADDSLVLITFNRTVNHDITIDGFSYTGPVAGIATPWDAYFPQNVTVQNCHFDNVAGLGYSDSNLTHDLDIKNNFIRTSANTKTQTDVVTFGDAVNVTIEGNYLVNQAPGQNNNGQHNDVIQTFHSGAGGANNPSGWVVRYNWIGLTMNTPFRTGDNSWMQLESFDNAAGFGLKIYGNVFVGGDGTTNSGNNGFGMDTHGITSTNYVYNNTVIRKNGPDRTIGWISANGTLFMRNNVGMATSGQNSVDVDVAAFTPGTGGWDYNFWYQFDGSVTSGSWGPHGSTSTNPLFANYNGDDFSLTAASPLIGAGDSTIGSEFSQGIAPGATWPNPTLVTRPNSAWDVGAFQSGGQVSRVNPPMNLSVAVQ